MKRWVKKTVAFGLAITMFAVPNIIHAEETSVRVIEEPKYDAAVSLKDNVVLVENGHWSYDETNYETGESKIITDVTAETKIVFVNSDGSKKVISNKDSKGEKIFDAVHPAITGLDGSEFIRIIKDNKAAYIRQDGTYIGEEGKFYAYAHVIDGEKILASEDGVNYKIEGLEQADTVEIPKASFRYVSVNEGNYYIGCNGKFIVLDSLGKIHAEYQLGDELAPNPLPKAGSLLNGGYYVIDESGTTIYNKDFEIIFTTEEITRVYSLSRDYKEYIYVQYDSTNTFKVLDGNNGQIVKEYSDWPSCINGYISGIDVNGMVSYYHIPTKNEIKINDMINQLAQSENFTDFETETTFSDGYIGISFYGYKNGEIIEVSYLLSEEDSFSVDKAIRIDGMIDQILVDKGVITTKDGAEETFGKLYKVDGTLVKDFSGDTKYYTRNANVDNVKGIVDLAYVEGTELFKNDWYAVKDNGELIGPYNGIVADERVLFAEVANDRIDVITADGVIDSYDIKDIGEDYNYYRLGEWFYSLKYNDYYGSFVNNKFAFKDIHGNKVEGALANLSGVGPCEAINNTCSIPTDISYTSFYYCYENFDLENGLCVTKKEMPNGDIKYGVISFKGEIIFGDCNLDGVVNATDALVVLKHAAKINPLNDITNADVTKDGILNADDALKMLKYAAKIIDSI